MKTIEDAAMNRRIKVLFVPPLIVIYPKGPGTAKKAFFRKRSRFSFKQKKLEGNFNNSPKNDYRSFVADVTFSWFAGYHGYWAVRLSKLFKKKLIVMLEDTRWQSSEIG